MITASLGAHYSPEFVRMSRQLFWQTLTGRKTLSAAETLRRELEKRFGGRAVLTYKGRDAIELTLRAYGIGSGDEVLTQAFSCFAIEEAIIRTGAVPCYADTGVGQLNLTAETLEAAYRQSENAKAVIVQHSLGHPAEMETIRQWCQKYDLLLIEDLAQSFGASVGDKELGTFGDAAVFSFGRDKVIDAVSGGAAVFRAMPSQPLPKLSLPPKTALLRDLLYPSLTAFIRQTYDAAIGKITHKLLTLTGLMTNPTASPTNTMTVLPEALAQLILFQLAMTAENRHERQTIASLYLEGLKNTPLRFITQSSQLESAALLRVAARTDDPVALLEYLRKRNIHLTDRWYRQPVDCGKLSCKTLYQTGSCPNAEALAESVINLPTHRKMTIKDTEKIITEIQKFFHKGKK